LPKTKAIPGQQQNSGNQHTVKSVAISEHLPGREILSLSGVPEVLAGNPESVAYWNQHAEPLRQSGRLNADTMPLFVMLCSSWGDWMDLKKLEAAHRKNKPAQRGKLTVKKKTARLTETAKAIPKAERHFAKLLSQFEEISARYAKPDKNRLQWPD